MEKQKEIAELEVIMKRTEWIRCPVCGGKTRDRIREDTVLKKLSSLLSEMQAGSQLKKSLSMQRYFSP